MIKYRNRKKTAFILAALLLLSGNSFAEDNDPQISGQEATFDIAFATTHQLAGWNAVAGERIIVQDAQTGEKIGETPVRENGHWLFDFDEPRSLGSEIVVTAMNHDNIPSSTVPVILANSSALPNTVSTLNGSKKIGGTSSAFATVTIRNTTNGGQATTYANGEGEWRAPESLSFNDGHIITVWSQNTNGDSSSYPTGMEIGKIIPPYASIDGISNTSISGTTSCINDPSVLDCSTLKVAAFNESGRLLGTGNPIKSKNLVYNWTIDQLSVTVGADEVVTAALFDPNHVSSLFGTKVYASSFHGGASQNSLSSGSTEEPSIQYYSNLYVSGTMEGSFYQNDASLIALNCDTNFPIGVPAPIINGRWFLTPFEDDTTLDADPVCLVLFAQKTDKPNPGVTSDPLIPGYANITASTIKVEKFPAVSIIVDISGSAEDALSAFETPVVSSVLSKLQLVTIISDAIPANIADMISVFWVNGGSDSNTDFKVSPSYVDNINNDIYSPSIFSETEPNASARFSDNTSLSEMIIEVEQNVSLATGNAYSVNADGFVWGVQTLYNETNTPLSITSKYPGIKDGLVVSITDGMDTMPNNLQQTFDSDNTCDYITNTIPSHGINFTPYWISFNGINNAQYATDANFLTSCFNGSYHNTYRAGDDFSADVVEQAATTLFDAIMSFTVKYLE